MTQIKTKTLPYPLAMIPIEQHTGTHQFDLICEKCGRLCSSLRCTTCTEQLNQALKNYMEKMTMKMTMKKKCVSALLVTIALMGCTAQVEAPIQVSQLAKDGGAKALPIIPFIVNNGNTGASQ